jgi:hypothetical protein
VSRSYHIATACIATQCDARWLDNLLSQHPLPGVTRERRGISRRIAPDALLLIAVIRILCEDLGLPVARAVQASIALADSADARTVLPSGLSLQIDMTRIRQQVDRALLEAAESHVVPVRGRPPRALNRPS